MQVLYCLGGDLRMYYAVKKLSRAGFLCRTFHVPGFEDMMPASESSRIFVLPFPSMKDGKIVGLSPQEQAGIPLEEPGSILIGGNISPEYRQTLPSDVTLFELTSSEAFLMNNAALTAECALGKAIITFPGALRGSRVLVLGHGRIGKHLTMLLHGCGAEVSVCARGIKELTYLRSAGFRAEASIHDLEQLSSFRCIFNTIPEPFIDCKLLDRLHPECYYYELASKPFGIRTDAAERLKERCIFLPGLPGKYAPEQAGIFYAQAVLCKLEEILCKNSHRSGLP